MPTPVSVARQCLTAEAAHALDEAVVVARKRGHSQTTSLHAVSAFLSLPTPLLRDACARVRNSAYSPRLQFRALELSLSVSLDRIQSGQTGSGSRSDDPPVSNSLMAAIKRSQAHQRRLPENFRLYHEMSQQQNQSALSCVKVELRQLLLSILDDPLVSRVFGEAGFRSSELKLSIIRPIPHVLRYPGPSGHPLFLCNVGENPEPGTGSDLYPVQRTFTIPYRNFGGLFDEDAIHRKIGALLARENGRNPLLSGVSASGALTDFLRSLEKRTDGSLPPELIGLSAINIGNDISDQITGNLNKTDVDKRFDELSKLVEQNTGPGLVLNYGDLRAFTDSTSGDSTAHYIVGKLSELLHRHGRRIWLIGTAVSEEVYYKFVRMFEGVEKDWDLQILIITSLRPCLSDKSYPKSSLMGSFVPFGGFFSSPSELKLPLPGFVQNRNHKKEVAGLPNPRPVSSVSDQYQSTLPHWLRMTTGIDLNRSFGSETKEGLESEGVLKSANSVCGSDNSTTIDLNLGICSVPTGAETEKHVEKKHDKDLSQLQAWSSSCLDHHKDTPAENFKIMYRTLIEKVSWQDEAARVISYAVTQQRKNIGTRRDIWFNFVGTDIVGKRKIAHAVAEIVYQSEQRFMGIDLCTTQGVDGCDNVIALRGRTMVDYILEGLCRNPFCVVFLENLEKADQQLRTSLSMAIQSGKLRDSHGREVSISNTTFVTSSSSEHSGRIKGSSSYSGEEVLRAKGRKVEVSIGIASRLPYMRWVNKRKVMGFDKTHEKNENSDTTKRSYWETTRVLDLNLPAQEIENRSEENLKLWLENFKNQNRVVNVPFKSFDFDGLAERIEKDIREAFEKCVNSECLLEIDPKMMESLLATVYFSESKDIYKDLMERTITRAFMEARERYEISSTCVVRVMGGDKEGADKSCSYSLDVYC